MSDIIIAVENLSKRYLVGHQSVQRERYTALRDVVAREARNFTRNAVDFVRGRQIVQGDEVEEFWALRDLSFEVKRGEVFGIIGRNGAGKSTLLKILSRITKPDSGRAILRGRVASLLEVGTGFHPELTGRENIFLNGVILGMRRAEIRRKFDEIVAFAEVERFIDTPVKRYSSGMYMRLAFSIAAHLEPEILIVDEVLAVGDAEFQRKCIGKMREVGALGRTVLFVSHNMSAMRALASRALVLFGGKVLFVGDVDSAVAQYSETISSLPKTGKQLGRGVHTAIQSAHLISEFGVPIGNYTPGSPLRLELVVATDGSPGLSIEIVLVGSSQEKLALASLHQFHGYTMPGTAGVYRVRFEIEPIWIASGSYSLDIMTSVVNSNWDHRAEGAVDFGVPYSNRGNEAWDFRQSENLGAFAMGLIKMPDFEKIDDLTNPRLRRRDKCRF